MFQGDSQAFGRNGGAPYIGRIQHTDQLHGPFLYMAISGGTTLAEVRSPANDSEKCPVQAVCLLYTAARLNFLL
jgi:hypothetical protein